MKKKELKELLDYECAMHKFGRIVLSFYPEQHAVFLFRKSQYHEQNKGLLHRIMKRVYTRSLVRCYGINANPHAKIGKGLRFVHPTSIVIGYHVVAGENLELYQNSTIGGAHNSDVHKGWQPTIGNNVIIYCGAAVLGNIKVEDNVTIAANSTLLKDAPKNSLCVGSPARIIQKS